MKFVYNLNKDWTIGFNSKRDWFGFRFVNRGPSEPIGVIEYDWTVGPFRLIKLQIYGDSNDCFTSMIEYFRSDNSWSTYKWSWK